MVTLLAAAAIVAAPPALAAPPAPAASAHSPGPAMFVVRDADTTIYLFGTFHSLDGDPRWLDGKVETAFDQSDELVLETLIPEGPPLPPTVHGIAPPAMTPSGSFLASTKVALSAGQRRGMQVDNGADMVLRHLAEARGKPVSALESLEFQLAMFNRMPPAAVTVRPRTRPGAAAEAPIQGLSRTMADMQSAWKRGDQSLFRALLEQMRTGSPAMYRMMFAERNARWAGWVAQRMRAPGTVFVAVGAGHFAGSDSVLVRLAELGILSRRVN